MTPKNRTSATFLNSKQKQQIIPCNQQSYQQYQRTFINLNKNHLQDVNNSVIIDSKNIFNRAKIYEKKMEDRKDQVKLIFDF